MTISTIPASVQMSTLDDPFTLQCDASTLPLARGETVTGVATTLTDVATGAPVTLTAAPGHTTTGGSQSLYGSVLTAGHSYRLAWVFTLSSGDALSEETIIVVAY